MAVVQLHNLGSVGITKDVPGHLLPPEAWTNGGNMQSTDTYIQRSLGYSAVFGTPNVPPGFIFYVPAAQDNFWLYADLESVHAYDGATHGDITRLAGPYTATSYRQWGGCLLGGVPILNNLIDVPQYWPSLAAATPLADLPNWPSTLRAKVIKNFGKYLVALNLIDNGNPLPHAIQWSHQADPGTVPSSWDVTDATVDAGRTHLTDIQGGEIVDGVLLANFLVIYKERSTHLLRYVGGNDILVPDLLFNAGLLTARGATAIDSGFKHFCVGEDDIYTHAGTKSIEYPLNLKDRRYFFNDLDTDNYVNLFTFDNPAKEEVWVCYPSSGSFYPNKALVYNYKSGATVFRDFQGSSIDVGKAFATFDQAWDDDPGSWDSDAAVWNIPANRKAVAADPVNEVFWAQDTGNEYGNEAGVSFLQRTGLAIIGRDRAGAPKLDFQSRRLVNRVWPKLSGSAVVEVRVGMQEELDGPITWTPYKTFDPTLRYVDFEISGRLPAIEFRSLSAAPWQLEGYDINIEVLGEN